MPASKLLGAWGEALAAEYLRKKNWRVIAHGYSCRYGEVDLIARNGKFILFVEVKLRKSASFASARDYVDRYKQDRIRMTASMYLSEYPSSLQPRFDVIEIYAPEGMKTVHPEIYHMEDAFQ